MFKFLKGFFSGIVFIIVLGLFLNAYGNDSLEAIYVSFNTVKKIIVDKYEVPMPNDRKPIVYNDRTYVPLRLLAEAMGKPVDWDGETGTVYIGEKPKANVVIDDDLSNKKNETWDINNSFGYWDTEGSVLQSKYYAHMQKPCLLPLQNTEYITKDLIMEVDFMVPSDQISKSQYLGFFFGGDFSTPSKSGANWICINYDGLRNITKPVYEEDSGNIYAPYDKYYRLKVIKNKMKLDVYVDDVFMYSKEMDNDFKEGYIGLFGGGYQGIRYYKNFKLTVIE